MVERKLDSLYGVVSQDSKAEAICQHCARSAPGHSLQDIILASIYSFCSFRSAALVDGTQTRCTSLDRHNVPIRRNSHGYRTTRPGNYRSKFRRDSCTDCAGCVLSGSMVQPFHPSLNVQELTENKNQLVDRVQTLRKVPSPTRLPE